MLNYYGILQKMFNSRRTKTKFREVQNQPKMADCLLQCIGEVVCFAANLQKILEYLNNLKIIDKDDEMNL